MHHHSISPPIPPQLSVTLKSQTEPQKPKTLVSESPNSTMSFKATFSLLLLFLLSLATAVSSANSTLSAYEVLEEYDFPIGILPNGVLGYELNSTTGAFEVYLNGTCTFSIDSYKLKYKSTITGYIATDKLTSLSGIYVKVWFFWLRIVKVTRENDELLFSVSLGSAEFPVSNFDECPTCGCGFDCDSVNGKKMKEDCMLKMKVKGLVASS